MGPWRSAPEAQQVSDFLAAVPLQAEAKAETRAHRHIRPLDGLRAIAILLVFVHHSWHVPLLWMGVDLFFVLSGFLITGILLRARGGTFGSYLKAFYRRRVQRILPAYIVALLVATIVYGGHWLHTWYMYLGLMNVAFVRRMPLPGPIPLWSLAVEEQFYFLWPVVVFYVPRRWLTPVLVGLLALAPVCRGICALVTHNHFAAYMLLPCRMDGLSLGALFAVHGDALERGMARLKGRVVWMVGAAWVVGWGTLWTLARMGISTYGNTPAGDVLIYECTLVLMGSLFLLAISGAFRPLFGNVVFDGLAKISYTVYLMHIVALDLLRKPVLAFVVTVAWASVSWVVLEKPILRWGRRHTQTI